MVMCPGGAARWLPGWAVFPQIGRCFVRRSQNLRTSLRDLPHRRPWAERAPGERGFWTGKRGNETPESTSLADGARRRATARRMVAARGVGQPFPRRDPPSVPRRVRRALRTTGIVRSGNRSARRAGEAFRFGGVRAAAAVAEAPARNGIVGESFTRSVCTYGSRRSMR